MSRNDDERAAGRAECFARLVLAGQQDAHGRNLLDHAELLAERLAMYREKEVGWLSASLGADRVDETTLTGVGFNIQQVRHATVVKLRAGESAGDYAERIAIYNEPDALAVAAAMLEDAAAINPAVPIETTDAHALFGYRRDDVTKGFDARFGAGIDYPLGRNRSFRAGAAYSGEVHVSAGMSFRF